MSAETFRSLAAARGKFGPCALAIGNFDGVHIGHEALLRDMVAYAHEKHLAPAVLTFDPHPTAIVAPERTPLKICSLERRLQLCAEAGAEKILVLPFTHEVAGMSPEAFAREILVDGLRTHAVFVGQNFHFGHRQAGTPETLAQLGGRLGFAAQFVEPVSYRGKVVSSSLIRQCLLDGQVSQAGRLLGRCFGIEGTVVTGHGIGTKQTVPTLNQQPQPEQIVPRGVYISQTFDLETGLRWTSITNCGIRPTFGGEALTVETFLLDALEGAKPRTIRVELRRFVREERRFADAESLKKQILKDVSRAQVYWRRVRSMTGVPSIY
jgi:riboflavin kinase/FMN adenylyltransferase